MALVKIEGGKLLFKVRLLDSEASKIPQYNSSLLFKSSSSNADVTVGYLDDLCAPEDFSVLFPSAISVSSSVTLSAKTGKPITARSSSSSLQKSNSVHSITSTADTEIIDTAPPTEETFTREPISTSAYPLRPTRSWQEIDLDSLPIDCSIQLNNAQCIPAGTYKIFAVLDNREQGMKRNRTFFQEGMLDKGLNVTTRPLGLGDVIWIAKTDSGDEIVLDTLVERKTIDDLIASIKDGRWKEQKHRLAATCLENIIYVIEESSCGELENFGREKILSAMGTTQVVNKFSIKRTSGYNDTLAYFIALTRYLEERIRHKDLYIVPPALCSKDHLASVKELGRQKFPDRDFYLTLGAYQEMNRKTGNMLMSDMFMKQLLTVKGVSADKCLTITKHYKTARSLRSAYLNCFADAELKALLKDKCVGVGRKAVTNAVSERIAQLFNDRVYSDNIADDNT